MFVWLTRAPINKKEAGLQTSRQQQAPSPPPILFASFSRCSSEPECGLSRAGRRSDASEATNNATALAAKMPLSLALCSEMPSNQLRGSPSRPLPLLSSRNFQAASPSFRLSSAAGRAVIGFPKKWQHDGPPCLNGGQRERETERCQNVQNFRFPPSAIPSACPPFPVAMQPA